MRRLNVKKFASLLLVALLAVAFVPSMAQDDMMELETGNVIFIHPDGTGLNHWNAARMYWYGPDATLNWDMLPEMAVYRGHMRTRLTGTSHGGATVHAFGYKMDDDSFGQDGGGEETRVVNSLSGFEGSIMREAANAGHPVGVVNDGDMAEPGTGAFLAEVPSRDEANEIVRQLIDGRPGFEGEPLPHVLLAGGERWYLPEGTPQCEDAESIDLDCHVHLDAVNGRGPAREDGRNLLQEAADLGYEIVRTRAEFEALAAQVEADETFAPMVLGLFAADDIFNDVPEEVLLDLGLIDESMEGTKEGRLLLYGQMPGTLGYNPPRPDEMIDLALTILERRSEEVGLPFHLVAEVESSDNLPNNANTIGFLNATKRADDLIGVAREFVANNPDTLIITAADSDGGGPQVFSPAPVDEDGNVTVSAGNPTGRGGADDEGFALDGIEGRGTAPFIAAPDAFGNEWDFAIGYPGRNDVAGGIISRAEGLNAELLRTEFATQFDSIDVYRIQYATLFGELLPESYGVLPPARD